jgi:short-subunit dehydrogenase
MASVLVVGGSRGLGAAFVKELSDRASRNWVLSRSAPKFLADPEFQHITWIRADLSESQQSAAAVGEAVGDSPIGTLIYNAGIWERSSLASVSAENIEAIVKVNLTSALTIIQRLLPNIRAVEGGTVVLIGSTCGLENEGAQVAGYVSTKFGLRGLAYALRESVRKDWIRVVCISPGSMATDVDLEDGAEAALSKHGRKRMPVGDIVALVRCVMNLSVATCVKEIIVPATSDTDV